MTNEDLYSLLRPARLRGLQEALAHYMTNRTTTPGSRRAAIGNRLYAALPPVDQLRCRSEIWRCRMARLGHSEARVEGGWGNDKIND